MIKKYFSFISNPEIEKVFGVKSSKNVFGTSFPDLAAQEAAVKLRQEDIGAHGKPYSGNPSERPAKGAFVIVPEEGAAEMLYALGANGLIRFTQRIAMDFSYKPVTIDDNPLTIEDTPVESEMVLRSPKNDGEPFTLAGRIILEDLQFLDGQGRPLFKEMPKIIPEQILKSLSPMDLLRAMSPTLEDMLKRSGANAEFFKSVLVETAKKWKGRPVPKDADTLEHYATLAILHEATHFLICHLPDNLSLLSPEEAQRQKAFCTDRYLEILNADESLSVVYSKNLAKALRSLREQTPSKETEAGQTMVVLIEMFCDRFSMFLFENYTKIQIYQSVFGDLYGDPFSVSTMLNFEDERKNDPAGFMAKHPEVTKEVMAALDKAETTHVYADPDTYGDPAVTPEEKVFFKGFLDLLKYFDKRGTILQFSAQHAATSRIMRATFSGVISKARVGLSNDEVTETSSWLPAPGDLAVTLGTRILNPRTETQVAPESEPVVTSKTPAKVLASIVGSV